MFKPAVIAGKPDDLEDFEKQEVDGIAVYLSKEIEAKADQIRIKLRGFGMFKRLALEVL